MSIKEKLGLSDSVINTYANHLVVVFILTMPLLISVRRLSLFLVILLFLLRGKVIYYVREAVKDPIIKAFSLYFIVHVIWLLGTDDYGNGKSTVHDAEFLLVTLLFSSFIDKRYIPRMKVAFFVGMFASILVSFGIFWGIIDPMPHYGDQGTPLDPTPVYHRTHYGFMLAISSIMALYYLINSEDKRIKIMLGVFYVCASFNIFITGGRFGYVLYIVGLFMIIILLIRKISWSFLLVLILVVVSVSSASYNLSPTLENKIDQTVVSMKEIIENKDYANSIGGRIGILDYSSDIVKENWLIGLGTGDQTGAIINEIRKKDEALASFFHELGHPHNEYLSALLQFGIIGLLLYLNIPLRMLRYNKLGSSNGDIFKILGVSILLFTLVDIFVLGLGMLLTVVILVSVNLNSYITEDAKYSGFNIKQGLYYLLTIVSFYYVQLIIP